MMKSILFCISLLLFGCSERTANTPIQNAVALANQQRHNVIATTRAASYIVYPDMPDPKIVSDPGFFEAAKAAHLQGTAFAVDDKGLMLTAAHVIVDLKTGANSCGQPNYADNSSSGKKKVEIYCTLITQTYKKVFRAKVVYIDTKNDVACLRAINIPGKLPFVKFAETGSFGDGSEVLTVGAPLGNANFTTVGYISNLDFVKQDSDEPPKIQFLATIQPGNSGGPLVDVQSGKLIGLVIEIFAISAMTPAGPRPISTGMSYATPVEAIRSVLKHCTE